MHTVHEPEQNQHSSFKHHSNAGPPQRQLLVCWPEELPMHAYGALAVQCCCKYFPNTLGMYGAVCVCNSVYPFRIRFTHQHSYSGPHLFCDSPITVGQLLATLHTKDMPALCRTKVTRAGVQRFARISQGSGGCLCVAGLFLLLPQST